MAKNKNKVYVVEISPGNYKPIDNWPECQALVHGKPYAYAGGKDRAGAMAKLKAGKKKRNAGLRKGFAGAPKKVHGGNLNVPKKNRPRAPDYPKVGITSDAGTHGNPGPCEYQVTDLNGKVLLHKKLGVHTNNYAELAGIGNMIQYAVKHGETVLWTDSAVAMIWIKSAKLGPAVREKESIMKMIQKIRKLLADHPELELRKWETRRWGQIPSDFGRK